MDINKTLLIMAVVGGATVANLYYNQPLLALIAESFHAPTQQVGLVPMMTQIGYALGLLLFVPLGDIIERRRLIVTMLMATALALLTAAISPNISWLIVASLLIGMTTIIPQLIVPFAAFLVEPGKRGKAVGTVMSGLFIGIVLARMTSGFVGANFGWRAIYFFASGLMILIAVISIFVLPKAKPSVTLSYPKLILSLGEVIREQLLLRQVALIGAMSFAAYSIFWSTMAFFLKAPPLNYSSQVAGMFGLVGIVGAIAAVVAGRMADRKNPRLISMLGVVISTSSFLVFSLARYELWGLILGVMLLDLGVQTTQISNQAQIYSLPAKIHSRLNTVYMGSYFVGGAMGSYFGNYAWSSWQWNGVCGIALFVLVSALSILYFTIFSKKPQQQILSLRSTR
ncbi:MAG: MFS transporter [Microcoleaceae cyanobacterium MO_207.B10]|nr:MFS transporter [Microcoleaceae cyanobacterium MO_207.B10]